MNKKIKRNKQLKSPPGEDSFLYIRNQKRRLKTVIKIAGPRYSPELNVDLPINSIFDGIGRTPTFFCKIKESLGKIKREYNHSKSKKVLEVAGNDYEKINTSVNKVINFLSKIDKIGNRKINFEKLEKDISETLDKSGKCIEKLRKIEDEKSEKLKKERQGEKQNIEAYERNEYSSEKHHLYKFISELRKLKEFCQSNEAKLSNNSKLFLNGIAGSGKTHLFCDVAKARIDKKLPTYIFLGEEFNNKNPWTSIFETLNIKGGVNNFLKKLNNYAKKQNTNAVIIIDALNEARSKIDWGLLDRIDRYKNIGLAISIRTGFEKQVLKQKQAKSFIPEEHRGFELKEWEAVKKFFTFFGLPMPEIPILRPEFQNPLFLLLFCKGVKKRGQNSKKQSFRGHEGTTFIFEQFIKNTADKIATDFKIKKGKTNNQYVIWDTIIEKIAEKMAKNVTIKDRISEREVMQIIKESHPSVRALDMLKSLEKNFLLVKVPKYSKKYKQIGYEYRFPFQKFSDHLIVRYLLKNYLDKQNPIKSFQAKQKLGKIIRGYWNRGLIEALSIQIPERLHGRELVYLAHKKFKESDVAQECFLESLIWRDPSLKNNKPKSFNTRNALKYINQYVIRTKYGHEKLLETFLTTSTIPNHPFNAELLHSHLMKFDMAKRDEWWLPFLHYRFGEDGPVDKLIIWAWECGNKNKINSQSVALAGTTLTWFLASSNRYLRDRATKALVSLLTERMDILIRILERFKRVNDPYISERLYAVAYGCAMRSQNDELIKKLVVAVYNLVFRDGKPPVDILLRDYARGVIEFALYKKLKIKIDINKIRPPYNSKWPQKILTKEELKKYDRKDYYSIWGSLFYNNGGGIADFGNYVVNSALDHWSSRRLGVPRKMSQKEIYDSFVANLNKDQKRLWDKRFSVFGLSILKLIEGKTIDNRSSKKTKQEEAQNENNFYSSLNQDQKKIYKKSVLPYLNSGSRRNEFVFDYALAQRYIFQKILKLGWRPKLFKEFDSSVNEHGRDAHKGERIGKKYQWISFYDLLARVSDNFEFREESWSDKAGIYEGPWQLSVRDIDPSCLLKNTGDTDENQKSWWIKVNYNAWTAKLSDGKWLQNKKDFPNIKKLIKVRDKRRKDWLILEGFFRWEQEYPPEEEKYEKPRRDLWIMVKSYLVKRKDLQKIYNWAIKQDFMGRWMPESHEFYTVFLREYPWAPSFVSINIPYYHHNEWTRGSKFDKAKIPTKILVTDDEYLKEGSGFDCSTDSGFAIKLPAKWIYDKMALLPTSIDGSFSNKKDEVIFQDPSVTENGPKTLLADRKELTQFLVKNGYDIFWTILSEKGMIGGGIGAGYYPGRLEISGAYKINSKLKISGKLNTKFERPQTERGKKQKK